MSAKHHRAGLHGGANARASSLKFGTSIPQCDAQLRRLFTRHQNLRTRHLRKFAARQYVEKATEVTTESADDASKGLVEIHRLGLAWNCRRSLEPPGLERSNSPQTLRRKRPRKALDGVHNCTITQIQPMRVESDRRTQPVLRIRCDLHGIVPVVRALWILVMVGCAPTIDGPMERARAADQHRAAQLAAQLRLLPSAAATHVMIRTLPPDPFTNAAPAPFASALIVIDDPVHRSSVADAATRLVRAAVPEVLRPEVVIAVTTPRPQLASVGPFNVRASARPWLIGALIVGLSLIGLFAGFIAWRERKRGT